MTDFWYMVAGSLIGALIGGAISFAVTAYYARQGSRELRHEAEDVRHYVNALISYLEADGLIQVRRDEDGRPIKVTIVKLSALGAGSSFAGANLSVGPKEENRRAQEREDRGDG